MSEQFIFFARSDNPKPERFDVAGSREKSAIPRKFRAGHLNIRNIKSGYITEAD
jgi:hypothetical protein